LEVEERFLEASWIVEGLSLAELPEEISDERALFERGVRTLAGDRM
jgi:hypothetical protein